MDLSWNGITDWAAAGASSLAKELPRAFLAAISLGAAKRYAAWKRGKTRSDSDASVRSHARNGRHSPGHAATSAHAQHVRWFRYHTSDPPKLTPEQEVDLIDRGLPERLVRVGRLDYASLTSACMADRIRNGDA